MAILSIAGTELKVKDYCCIESGDFFKPLPGEEYLKKPKPALWLYVNLTDKCNASCEFCVSYAGRLSNNTVAPEQFRKALQVAAPHIYGISFTGGEPMLYPELLDELIFITKEIVPSDMEIDLATNGTNLNALARLQNIDRISSVHISRHSFNDEVNTRLMGRKGPSTDEIRAFVEGLNDPGKVVFNCVLQEGGVESCKDVAAYLDMAIDAKVQNSSFITMFKANDYCEEHYLSAYTFPFVSELGYAGWNKAHPNAQFDVWNRHSDYEYCHCLSGSYRNAVGRTRFYFRCPGNDSAPDYCRQLVYTASNDLQDGFGTGRKVILSRGI